LGIAKIDVKSRKDVCIMAFVLLKPMWWLFFILFTVCIFVKQFDILKVNHQKNQTVSVAVLRSCAT